ncbi:MAG: hypothetical protein HC894_14780 [Microcoleus sp. SM1_3_4]|nr:hypothetical protein [Microcoleus sp. SM1_3_4]
MKEIEDCGRSEAEGIGCINLDLVYQCCWLDRQLGRYLRLLLKKAGFLLHKSIDRAIGSIAFKIC